MAGNRSKDSETTSDNITSIHNLLDKASNDYVEKFTDRFWSKVDTSGECWVWTGYTTSSGYGRLQFYDRNDDEYTNLRAHRVSKYLEQNKPIDSYQVNHNCHNGENRKCCNPDHLYLGTARQNSADAVKNGNILSGRNHPNAKFSDEEVRNIRKLYHTSDMNQKEVAKKFNCARTTISNIINFNYRKSAGGIVRKTVIADGKQKP